MAMGTLLRPQRLIAIFLAILALWSMGCGGGSDTTGSGVGPSPGSGTLNLAWDSNTEPDLAGYKVYYGTSPGVYGPPVDIGMATQSGGTTRYTLTNIVKGQTYYVAIQAYNVSLTPSPLSNEASGVAK